MAAADRCREEGGEGGEEGAEEQAGKSAPTLASANTSQVGNGAERELLATADGNAGASCCGERAYCDHEQRRVGQEQSGGGGGGGGGVDRTGASAKRREGGEETRTGLGRQTTTTTTTTGVSLQDSSVSTSSRPVILITGPQRGPDESASGESEISGSRDDERERERDQDSEQEQEQDYQDDCKMEAEGEVQEGAAAQEGAAKSQQELASKPEVAGAEEDQFEVIDGISYRIVAAVTRKPQVNAAAGQTSARSSVKRRQSLHAANRGGGGGTSGASVATGQGAGPSGKSSRFSSVRRKSSAFVANLLHSGQSFLVPQSRSSNALSSQGQQQQKPRRMSIYEMTKTPPPETSIEMYLNERRRSSTVSAKFVAQQLEQQSTFETNYCARQQYFKDLNAKLINQDKKLLNVVANRGQIHRHSVDIAQLPLFLATQSSQASSARVSSKEALDGAAAEVLREEDEEQLGAGGSGSGSGSGNGQDNGPRLETANFNYKHPLSGSINQVVPSEPGRERAASGDSSGQEQETSSTSGGKQRLATTKHLAAISEDRAAGLANEHDQRQRDSLGSLALVGGGPRRTLGGGQIVRRFQKFDSSALSSAPSPDVKIGQRVAYKEYYGNEFGTIRWIGRVPQISPDWTVGVEFDNAIGEGDGSLNGRRYFIAKDCFAKFLALSSVTLVDQHVGRPEPGTMISVMSAAVRPGQMISIQRVSTVHVQHCFLNAPHRRPGAEFLAVNTRLHCQCPNCGPCAHVVKPPRTQRLVTPKNATHMCQFSTYTCCGMESSDEALCTYTGNKISSLPPPPISYATGGSLPPLGNSWMDGSGYLSQLQAEQRKLMPEEYRLGAAPEDAFSHAALLRRGSSGKRRGHQHQHQHQQPTESPAPPPPTCDSWGRGTMSASPVNEELKNNHHHRHHHHHHKHHRHRHRHKSPGPAGQTGKGETQPTCVNLDGRASGTLIDMQNGGQPLTNSDELAPVRSSGNDQGLEDGGGELRNQESEARVARGEGERDEEQGDEERHLERALRAVQHRDSIENRYLFPTDDIIDSLLEADLETLSQARYGGHARQTGRRDERGHSSASSSSTGGGVRRSGRGRGARKRRRATRNQPRRNHSSRCSSSVDSASGWRPNPILQRLRSLVVSCMSAADGQASPSKSNSNLREQQTEFEYTTLGRPDSRAQQFAAAAAAASGTANSESSQRPLSPWHDEHAEECYCRQQGQVYATAALAQQTTITNEIITTNGELAHQNEQHGETTMANEQANKAHPALLDCDHHHQHQHRHRHRNLSSDNLYSNDLNFANHHHHHHHQQHQDVLFDPFESCDKLASHLRAESQRRQKLICSQAAGRRARGASGARRPAPSSRACRHRRGQQQQHQQQQHRRHASSSSDCGFSSASQNSINLSQQQHHQQPPVSSSSQRSPLEDLEKRAVSDLYRRLAGRLATDLSASRDTQEVQTGGQPAGGGEFSQEELLKLRSALLERHSETCCLHHNSTSSRNTSSPPPLQGQEYKASGQEETAELNGTEPTKDCALLLIADLLRCNSPTKQYHNRAEAADWCTCASATCRTKQVSSGSCDSGHLSSLVCNLSEQQECRQQGGARSHLEEDTASTIQMDEFEDQEHQRGRGSRMEGQSPCAESGANIGGRAEVKLMDETTSAASKSLPRAFELKLTLSINPEKTSTVQAEL